MLRYLQGTKGYALRLGNRDSPWGGVPLQGWVDSTHAERDDSMSTTGYLFQVYGSTVYAKSVKQRCVCTSSTESELVAASQASRQGLYLRRLLYQEVIILVIGL